MPTIAILSVSAGAGHVRAAQAIEASIGLAHPGVTAVHLDVMDLVPRLFRKLYAESYLTVVDRHPALWGYLYHTADRARPDSTLTRLRQGIERLNARRFARTIHQLNPDYIICTHFLPAQLLSRMIAKEGFAKPVWVVVTDFDVHMLWVHQHLTGYCAAAEEISWRMRDRGLGTTRIEVTGIPIMPVFSHTLSRAACAAELGIDPGMTTLLMMSGGFGVGALDTLSERLLRMPGRFQIIALAGRNQALLERLKGIQARNPGRLLPLGFTSTIERVMTCADVAITKPGGLTSSECLAMGLPMLVISPIPGQEERNSDYLLEHGVALKAHDAAGLEFRARLLLHEPQRLAAMRANAMRIAQPAAGDRVVKAVMGHPA
jgi:processive 1,2-diacylglycerol beta-glucosyltransferase